MRSTIVTVLLLAWCGLAWADRKPKVAVLGLEVVGAADKAAVRLADDVTVALRLRPKAGQGPWAMAAGSERDLLEEKLLASCETEAVACMATIGVRLGTDVLVYGAIEKRPRGYQVTLRALDVAKQALLKTWTDVVPAADAADSTKTAAFARKGYVALAGDPAVASAPAGCDAAALAAAGDAAMSNGTYAAALVKYEAAYACKVDETVLVKALICACKSRNATKSKALYPKLPPVKQRTYGQICIREGITL